MIATEPLPPRCGTSRLAGRETISTAATCSLRCSGRPTTGSRSAAAASRTSSARGRTREWPSPRVVVERLRGVVRDLFRRSRGGSRAAWRACSACRATGGRRSAPTRRAAWLGRRLRRSTASRPPNLAAARSRDLILGRDTELTRLPWVGPLERRWEPEPFRYAGIHAVHKLLGVADRRELRTGKQSVFIRVAGTISGRGR